MRTVNASQYFFVDCSKYMCSVSDSQYFVVDLGYRLAIFDLKNTDSSVISLWIFEPDEAHKRGLFQNVETGIIFCFINRNNIICKNVFDVWFWLKISNCGFLTLLWTGIPVKPNSRQFWKGKVLSHKCRLILSNKQLLGESVLKAPHLRFTERRHVRKEHTGKISLDHGANITSQFQVGFDIHCT